MNVFIFCKDVFPHLPSFLGSLGGCLHFNSVKCQNLSWIDLFTEKNKKSNSKWFFLVRVETNVLEVKFKIDLLEDSVSSHLLVPAQPSPTDALSHTRQPLCGLVSNPSPYNSVNSSQHSLEAPWGRFSIGGYERRSSRQLTPFPGKIVFFLYAAHAGKETMGSYQIKQVGGRFKVKKGGFSHNR